MPTLNNTMRQIILGGALLLMLGLIGYMMPMLIAISLTIGTFIMLSFLLGSIADSISKAIISRYGLTPHKPEDGK